MYCDLHQKVGFLPKITSKKYLLTETCKRQVGDNAGSWTLWSVIWDSCGSCLSSCSGGRSRSWFQLGWGRHPRIVTTDRSSAAGLCLRNQYGGSLTECSHDVEQTEARTLGKIGWRRGSTGGCPPWRRRWGRLSVNIRFRRLLVVPLVISVDFIVVVKIVLRLCGGFL